MHSILHTNIYPIQSTLTFKLVFNVVDIQVNYNLTSSNIYIVQEIDKNVKYSCIC